MKIGKIIILEVVEEHMLKHGITSEDVENALRLGNPIFSKDRNDRYLALTPSNKYLTIIFEYKNSDALIITAYQSSDWQIRKYKRK